MSLFNGHAQDVNFNNDDEFFEAIGYLASPGRLEMFEAQVPVDKIKLFQNELPGQIYYPISIDNDTSNGNKMKTGIQLRLYFANIRNIPISLSSCLVNDNRINKGLFAENLLKSFGFRIGTRQHPSEIRSIVAKHYEKYLSAFDRGYLL